MNEPMTEQAAPPVAQPTEQTTAKPSKGPSVFDGTPYIQAEQLKGKQVTMTIKRAVSGIEFVDNTGRKNKGIDLHFVETEKKLGVVGMTVRRQLCAVMGSEFLESYAGKKLTIYPVESKKAATGQAIRIKVEGMN